MRIVEVGPRDGLQNEPGVVSTEAKLAFVTALAAAGLREIEVTSFVHPGRVPQMADADALWPMLPPGPVYSALVPNERGLARARAVGVRRAAYFTAASDAFTSRNIGRTVEESLADFATLVAAAPEVEWRAYVSTVFECPYSGLTDPGRVGEIARRLLEIGAFEVALGDTTGVGVPREVRAVHAALGLPPERVAWHFHDTRGTALANVQAALDLGYEAFDAAAGGLGGCPFAPGAKGNVATESLVYLLERSGFPTGVDAEAVVGASRSLVPGPSRSRSA